MSSPAHSELLLASAIAASIIPSALIQLIATFALLLPRADAAAAAAPANGLFLVHSSARSLAQCPDCFFDYMHGWSPDADDPNQAAFVVPVRPMSAALLPPTAHVVALALMVLSRWSTPSLERHVTPILFVFFWHSEMTIIHLECFGKIYFSSSG